MFIARIVISFKPRSNQTIKIVSFYQFTMIKYTKKTFRRYNSIDKLDVFPETHLMFAGVFGTSYRPSFLDVYRLHV